MVGSCRLVYAALMMKREMIVHAPPRIARLMRVALAKSALVFNQGVFATLVGVGGASAEAPLKFDLPVRCTTLGDTANPCRVQNRVDMDPSDIRLDGLCQRHTYNNHKGTDFRVVTLADMAKNVPVIAMADGVVVGLRDGMADRGVTDQASRRAVKGKECGNGLMLKHRNGWTTQYCHLLKGSVAWKKGARVKRGERLGAIGLSGFTEFPHVHVSVRRGKQVMDPLSGRAMGQPACGVPGAKMLDAKTALFTPAAVKAIERHVSPLMEAGFSSATVKRKQAQAGQLPKPALGKPLVFYGYFMNINRGDRMRITVTQADGTGERKVWVRQISKPLPVDRPSHVIYAGRKSGPKAGYSYEGQVELIREGRIIFVSKKKRVRF
ncbi:MAG: M23 family metallopeptidase [Pseudomonadota bacterium]